ncbi:MAG: glycosyltransferase family 2 protein [Candidatus Bathyarchaeia archaeon]
MDGVIVTFLSWVITILLFGICVWGIYNLPILAVGIKDSKSARLRCSETKLKNSNLLTYSIIIPAKNEEKVISRLLHALSMLNYPAANKEIIVVIDGSNDKTFDICKRYAEEHERVKVLVKSTSDGKPSALNFGLKHAAGDIVAVFDADSVPDANILSAVSKYFADPHVAAVQGRSLSINAKENMLTEFVSYEDAVWCEAYLRGKDALNLFVHLRGSCQFVRRVVLEKLGGFHESFLSEDMELSARLLKNGLKIRYAPDVMTWQENPPDLKTFFRQRTRWFRGTMEVALKYGRLIANPNLVKFDAEMTLFGPFILIFSTLPFVAGLVSFVFPLPFGLFWNFTVQLAVLTTMFTLLLCGLALFYVTKPRRLKNILWLPFVYSYWNLQAVIATYSLLLILLRRPRLWKKTSKSGVITVNLKQEELV